MKLFLRFLCISACLLTTHGVLSAQQALTEDSLVAYRDVSLAVFGSYNLNQHSAGMRGLPTIPSCCPTYDNGSGTGFILGAMLDMYIIDDFTFQGRVGIHSGGGLLRALENEVVNTDGTEQNGVFEHVITSKHLWLTIEPMIAFAPIDRMQLLLGPSVGLLLSASFSQRETILQPSDALFENDSTSRAIYSGEIPQRNSVAFGVTGGLRYEIPVPDSDWSIAPELFYTLALTNLQQSQAWKMNAIRLGLSVQYSFWIDPLP